MSNGIEDPREVTMQVWIGGILIVLACECLGDVLKTLMPSSKKKKKGSSSPLDEVQTLIVNPIRGALKQIAVHYQENMQVKTHSVE